MGWMNDGDGMDQREQGIIDRVGVGGHFHHNRILLGQVLLGPLLQMINMGLMRAKNLVELVIDTDGDEIMFVDVQPDEPIRGRID